MHRTHRSFPFMNAFDFLKFSNLVSCLLVLEIHKPLVVVIITMTAVRVVRQRRVSFMTLSLSLVLLGLISFLSISITIVLFLSVIGLPFGSLLRQPVPPIF